MSRGLRSKVWDSAGCTRQTAIIAAAIFTKVSGTFYSLRYGPENSGRVSRLWGASLAAPAPRQVLEKAELHLPPRNYTVAPGFAAFKVFRHRRAVPCILQANSLNFAAADLSLKAMTAAYTFAMFSFASPAMPAFCISIMTANRADATFDNAPSVADKAKPPRGG